MPVRTPTRCFEIGDVVAVAPDNYTAQRMRFSPDTYLGLFGVVYDYVSSPDADTEAMYVDFFTPRGDLRNVGNGRLLAEALVHAATPPRALLELARAYRDQYVTDTGDDLDDEDDF